MRKISAVNRKTTSKAYVSAYYEQRKELKLVSLPYLGYTRSKIVVSFEPVL